MSSGFRAARILVEGLRLSNRPRSSGVFFGRFSAKKLFGDKGWNEKEESDFFVR